MMNSKLRVLAVALTAGLLTCSSCVNVDPQTDEIIPRGSQRYKFAEVVSNVGELKLGMSRYQVLMLLGSPAEESKHGDVWVYLPERPAVLIPGRALRLEFKDGRLADHSYHPIILGERF